MLWLPIGQLTVFAISQNLLAFAEAGLLLVCLPSCVYVSNATRPQCYKPCSSDPILSTTVKKNMDIVIIEINTSVQKIVVIHSFMHFGVACLSPTKELHHHPTSIHNMTLEIAIVLSVKLNMRRALKYRTGINICQ